MIEHRLSDRAWLMVMMFALAGGAPGMFLHLLQRQQLEPNITVVQDRAARGTHVQVPSRNDVKVPIGCEDDRRAARVPEPDVLREGLHLERFGCAPQVPQGSEHLEHVPSIA
jgi:hypothetical protein